MAWVISAHASTATVALLLGGYNLRRQPKGDRIHRRVGRVWVVAMYFTVLSSFAIKELRPGHYSWIHGLSLLTLVTLTIGLWAAVTGRAELHRRFIAGSYLGLVGAFVGAVAVPARDIPQLAMHRPFELALAVLGCVFAATAAVALCRRSPAPSDTGGTGNSLRRRPVDQERAASPH
jgi:uncharacterized membrane protein